MHNALFLAAASILAASTMAQVAPAPCFEQNRGTNLNLGDDATSGNLALGFTFAAPGGPVTSIVVSSNGFIWLRPSTNNNCCSGSALSFITDLPCIAPFWTDLDPSSANPGGGVFFNTFPAGPGGPARAVVTWADLPEYAGSVFFTFQLQILATGEIVFWYDDQVSSTQFNTSLTGITDGNVHQGGTAIPNPVDLSTASATTPLNTGTNPTVYEELTATYDLNSRSLEFIPNSQGGYLVLDRPTCRPGAFRPFGQGCPMPPTVYEFFPLTTPIDLSNSAILFLRNGNGGWVVLPTTGFFTGYTNAIATGDDVISGPFTLPFTWPFPGGTTTQIDVDSNGSVIFNTGSVPFSRCCAGDPNWFLTDPPTAAGHWMDHNPSQGGAIYVDNDPVGGAVHVTWLNVPEFGATNTSTFQISLFQNGNLRFSYQNVTSTGSDSLTGVTIGNGSADPGSVDLSTALPIVTGSGGTPLRLRGAPNSRPAIGGPCTMELDQITTGSVFGILVLGFGRAIPSFDLTPLGMPGCMRHVTVDSTVAFGLTGPPTPYTLNIPNNTSFLGWSVYAQGATLTPGANALGAYASNGLELRIGR